MIARCPLDNVAAPLEIKFVEANLILLPEAPLTTNFKTSPANDLVIFGSLINKESGSLDETPVETNAENDELKEFYKITSCPVLLNTSLNLAGKPIAGYPQDALQLFHSSEIDVMVIGNNIYIK